VHPFSLERPRDLAMALALGTPRRHVSAEYIAGGTDMLQLLREDVRRPDRLVALGTAVLDDGIEVRQVAAETLGLPLERVRFELGDTRLPPAPEQGGSMTMATVGSAVQAACARARRTALARAGLAGGDLAEVMRRIGHRIRGHRDARSRRRGGAVFDARVRRRLRRGHRRSGPR